MSIRLNSSKQVQDPVKASPIKSFSIILTLIWSEQLKTRQNLPSTLARSLQDSVLPVPAGPAGLAPNFMWRAPVIVIQHLSVKGVFIIILYNDQSGEGSQILISIAQFRTHLFCRKVVFLPIELQLLNPPEVTLLRHTFFEQYLYNVSVMYVLSYQGHQSFTVDISQLTSD